MWKCCKNIVDVTTFFYSFTNFVTSFFFFSFSAMPLPQLPKQFFFPPYGNGIATIRVSQIIFFLPISAMSLPQLVCQNFFSFHFRHSMHSHPGSGIKHRKFGIPIAEIGGKKKLLELWKVEWNSTMPLPQFHSTFFFFKKW